MQYKFAENKKYEDLSCGRVIYHKTGFTNYPVRLACEIFMRCIDLFHEPDKKLCVYDPCCGGGYLLTVLGFLYNDKIDTIFGSDVSEKAVSTASKNLKLLTKDGLAHRREELEGFHTSYGKESHRQAVDSIDNLSNMIRDTINCNVFKRDILEQNESVEMSTLADIIITDVPYGNLISWSSDTLFAIDIMLENLYENLNNDGVVAISSDKRQKISNPNYKRVKKLQIGKRKIEFFRKM